MGQVKDFLAVEVVVDMELDHQEIRQVEKVEMVEFLVVVVEGEVVENLPQPTLVLVEMVEMDELSLQNTFER